MNAQTKRNDESLAEAALIHASACHASTYHGEAFKASERRVVSIADELIARAAIAKAVAA